APHPPPPQLRPGDVERDADEEGPERAWIAQGAGALEEAQEGLLDRVLDVSSRAERSPEQAAHQRREAIPRRRGRRGPPLGQGAGQRRVVAERARHREAVDRRRRRAFAGRGRAGESQVLLAWSPPAGAAA